MVTPRGCTLDSFDTIHSNYRQQGQAGIFYAICLMRDTVTFVHQQGTEIHYSTDISGGYAQI